MAQKPVPSHQFSVNNSSRNNTQDEQETGNGSKNQSANSQFNKHKKAPSFQQAYHQFAQRLIKDSALGKNNFQTNVLLPSQSMAKFK